MAPTSARILGSSPPEPRFLVVKQTAIGDRYEITDWFAEVKNLVSDITVGGQAGEAVPGSEGRHAENRTRVRS